MKFLFLTFLLFPFLLSNAQWTTGTDIYNTNSGNVGIGTNNPQAKLHIADGDVIMQNTSTGYPKLYLKDISGTLRLRLDYNSAIAEGDNLYLQSYANNIILRGNLIGINTTTPAAKLHLVGNVSLPTEFRTQGVNLSSSWFTYFGTDGSNPDFSAKIKLMEENVSGLSNGFVLAAERYNGSARYSVGSKDNTPVLFFTNGSERFRITEEGNIGIGTSDTKGYLLAVNGDAIFTRIKVKQYPNWPDYVFDSGYRLSPLSELEAFIQKNKHLPGIASANEVGQQGIDIADTQAGLLKNLEELTLQVIQQNKLLQQQQQTIDQLAKRLEQLEEKGQ